MNEQLDRIELKLAEIEGKLDEANQKAEKARMYSRWIFWITVAVIVSRSLFCRWCYPDSSPAKALGPACKTFA